jgi:hypothetical protein
MYSAYNVHTLTLTPGLDECGLLTRRTGHFTTGNVSVPIVLEAGWAPGAVLKDAEKLETTAIQSTDRPSRSQSPFRLSYSGPLIIKVPTHNNGFIAFFFRRTDGCNNTNFPNLIKIECKTLQEIS